MPKAVKDLTSDQLRRIFRDYLKGVPKERLIKKYDLSESTFWEIVGMYSKKKHPNDVGNAQDIKGPADLLVSSLDTGSAATENPIVAHSPKDFRVTQDTEVKEYDYNSPEEELRKKGGEINDLIASRNADKAKEEREAAREEIEDNKETTGAILKELSEVSKAEAEARKSQAAEAAKATPSPEDLRRLQREAAEKRQIADQAAEAKIDQTRADHFHENQERDQKLIEAGEKQNEKLAKEEAKAREKEQKQRASDAEKLRKEAEDAGRKLEEATSPASSGGSEAGSSDIGGRGSEGTGSDRQSPGAGGEGVVEKSNTSPTAKPNPVEPAKVEPGAGKTKGK